MIDIFSDKNQELDHVEEVFGAFTIFGLVTLGGLGALGTTTLGDLGVGVVALESFGKYCFQVNIQLEVTERHCTESWFRRFSNMPENIKPEKNLVH